MHRPIHGCAALLHPAYKGPRLHSDEELSSDRDAYLKITLDNSEQAVFLEELIKYHDQRGAVFTNSLCMSRESMVKPLFWWESFGYQMPHVQRVALRLLSQVNFNFFYSHAACNVHDAACRMPHYECGMPLACIMHVNCNRIFY